MAEIISSPKAHTITWPFQPKTAEDLDYNFDVLQQTLGRLIARLNSTPGIVLPPPPPPPHASTHETGGSDPIEDLDAVVLTSGSLDYARIQVNSPRLLGRSSGGTGSMEALLVGTGLSLAAGTLSLGAHASSHNTGGSDPITALDASVIATGILTAARGGTGVSTGLTVLDASNLTTGSMPFARIQLSTNRLLGRINPGTGAMEQIIIGAGLQTTGGTTLEALLAPSVAATITGVPWTFDSGSVAAPTATSTGGSGTRLIFASGSPPYAHGVETSAMWAVVPSSAAFRWYQSTTLRMRLTAAGTLELVNGSGTLSLDDGFGTGNVVASTIVQLIAGGTHAISVSTSTGAYVSHDLLVGGQIAGSSECSATYFRSQIGTASAATGVATTVLPLLSGAIATYIVRGSLGSAVNDAANYGAVALVTQDGTVAKITSLATAGLLTITLSGLNVQITQNSGVTQTVMAVALRIS